MESRSTSQPTRTTATQSPVITLDAVTKRYGDLTAVNAMTLDVYPGELLVLLGSSGCGKTTTLRLMAGLEAPDTGRITMNGELVAGAGKFVPPEDRQIGMVFQDYALFPHLSVSANIAFGLNHWKRRERDSRIAALLTLVGLAELGERYPHQLSGGQQQRVALARALAAQPSVVFLDEPFSNLDAALRREMRGELKRILHEAGTTAVFVTHDQQEALSLADRIAIIHQGRLLQADSPQTIYTHPVSRYVASFVGEATFLTGQATDQIAQTALGEVVLSEPAEGLVELLVRPEDLTLTTPDHGVPVTVTSVEFFGHDQLVSVALADGTSLALRASARDQIVTGMTRYVRVDVPLLPLTM